MNKPDILIFISDQHSPLYEKSRGGLVDTPNLDRMKLEGTSFQEAYTSCPLCVPARMSMLSGLLPSVTGVLTNQDTLADLTPTFLHCLAADGYETVLIGRMHFVGENQRHGFTRRLAGDITPVSWNRPDELLNLERGVYKSCFGVSGCTDIAGGGESPVQSYDQMVIERARAYLSEDHDKPQCIVVGTYAPHFPYAAPVELYEKYRDQVRLPRYFHQEPSYRLCGPMKARQKNQVSDATALEAMTAYCGLIEWTDRLIGVVYDLFHQYEDRKQEKGYFMYLSDHGDQVGERRIYGKSTFFEKSSKIPFYIQGPAIPAGLEISSPVSIMDIGPTVCALAGTKHRLDGNGLELLSYISGDGKPEERIVWSETMGKYEGNYSYGVMGRFRGYKYMSYHHFEDQALLFDCLNDPDETVDLSGEMPEFMDWFRKKAAELADPDRVETVQRCHDSHTALWKAFESSVGTDHSEHWGDVPEEAKQYPVIR